jgi:hypothetical protein
VRHPRVVHKAEEVRAAPPNKSFDTDARVLQCASRTRLPIAGHLKR